LLANAVRATKVAIAASRREWRTARL